MQSIRKNSRFKLVWFRRLRRYFESALSPDRPAIWVGDLNVAPEPIDVYHSDKRINDPDFHIDARKAYKEAVAWGFVDVFRKLHPDVIQYTYWDYYRNALQRNFGWRIDHILATAPLGGTLPDRGGGHGAAEDGRRVGSYDCVGRVRLMSISALVQSDAGTCPPTG